MTLNWTRVVNNLFKNCSSFTQEIVKAAVSRLLWSILEELNMSFLIVLPNIYLSKNRNKLLYLAATPFAAQSDQINKFFMESILSKLVCRHDI